MHRLKTAVLWLDALGLVAFTVIGCDIAASTGAHPVVVILMGMATGVFGGLLKVDEPPVARPVLSGASAAAVRAMMERATWPGGTAPRARVPGYRVAGKTSTAHKPVGGATPSATSPASSVSRRCRGRASSSP